MNIVVLDQCTLTVGDLDFSVLNRLADHADYYDILTHDQIIRAAQNADILLCNKAVIDEHILSQCPRLKYIGLFATGYNNIDIEAARRRGILVANVPDYSTDSVAQLVLAMILTFATNIDQYNASTHSGDWICSYTFSYFPYPITELAGKTLGIFGFGAIGQKVALVANALGMKIIFHTRTQPQDCPYRSVDRRELFSSADYLTFHCPLTSETAKIVNEDTLALMKKSAYLINTARGGLIDEHALYRALFTGQIAGAALDVLTVEPMAADNPLLRAPNCIITPHVAWASAEARSRLLSRVAENIAAFLNGAPIHIVNP